MLFLFIVRRYFLVLLQKETENFQLVDFLWRNFLWIGQDRGPLGTPTKCQECNI